jgi:hypothetical protein
VRDVDDDRHVGLERERAGDRAPEAGLLLRRRHRADLAGRAAGLGDQPRRLQRHPGPEAVVHRARRVAPVGQLDRLAGDDRDVADPHHPAGVVAVAGADVDVQVLELRHLLALVGLEEVDRLLADHAGDPPLARRHLDALADEDHRVPAADLAEPQQPVVVDVGDDQPDLVDVTEDRDERPAGTTFPPAHSRDGAAHDVALDGRERPCRLAPGRGRLGLRP